MTSTTEDRLVALVAGARSHITGRNVVIVVLAIALVFSYCSGRASKNREVSASQYAATEDLFRDTVQVLKDRLRVETLLVVKYVKVAAKARETYTKTVAPVLAMSDSASIPASLVIPAIKACDVALASADSVNAGYQRALADAVKRGDYALAGWDSTVRQLRKSKPRFGFKSGLFSGIALTATLVKALR